MIRSDIGEIFEDFDEPFGVLSLSKHARWLADPLRRPRPPHLRPLAAHRPERWPSWSVLYYSGTEVLRFVCHVFLFQCTYCGQEGNFFFFLCDVEALMSSYLCNGGSSSQQWCAFPILMRSPFPRKSGDKVAKAFLSSLENLCRHLSARLVR